VVLNIANEDKKLQTPADNTFICQENLKLERDMTLCGDNWLYEEASLKKSGSFTQIKIKFKCKKRYFHSTDMF
jgi:hypothetical protein